MHSIVILKAHESGRLRLQSFAVTDARLARTTTSAAMLIGLLASAALRRRRVGCIGRTVTSAAPPAGRLPSASSPAAAPSRTSRRGRRVRPRQVRLCRCRPFV